MSSTSSQALVVDSSPEETNDDPGAAVVRVDDKNGRSTENTEETGARSQVCSFYLEGRCRFGDACFRLHPPQAEVKVKTKKVEVMRAEKAELSAASKKPPMKTAGDVKNRILWDTALPLENFIIGYLDRFDGVVEKPFSAFRWEHLALVPMDELAVPQHRIQYFKYRNIIVWDKKARLDLVFGSAGEGPSLWEVIDREDANHLQVQDQSRESDLEPDSDDEDIAVSTGGGTVPPGVNIDHDLRATHFFCVRVKSQAVAEGVEEVQRQIVGSEPILQGCVMPRELLHVTLAMVRCSNVDGLVQASRLLQSLKPQMDELRSPSSQASEIRAMDLSTFGARVLYAGLQLPPAFGAAVDMLHEGIAKLENVQITNHFDFVPHMTLLKVNRPTARARRSQYLNSCLYSDHIDRDFGSFPFDNIHLCTIEDARGPDGFYLTTRRINF